ncbi:cytosine permease [Peribacillus sp. SCS-37]|uniref:cytosine permease n=1 Tax=Paraperibacillus esterisolvens TaxID=3115296 RepID=UPI003906089D
MKNLQPLNGYPFKNNQDNIHSLNFYLEETLVCFLFLFMNIPDLTRFSMSQKDQLTGQGIGLPLMMTFFAFISIMITAGTRIAFGKPITNPVELLTQFNNPIMVLLGAFSLLIATLSVKVAANVVKTGLISIVIGLLFAPWLWFNNANSINSIVGAIGGKLGPVSGIMIGDYFIIRKKEYDLNSFFTKEGQYSYNNGWNPLAFTASGIGIIVALVGLFIPSLASLYTYNWFLGIAVEGISYFLLMRRIVKLSVQASKDKRVSI